MLWFGCMVCHALPYIKLLHIRGPVGECKSVSVVRI